MSAGNFFTGTPGRFEQRSTFGPEQQQVYQNLINSINGQGAGGAFGDVADYNRSLLSDNSSTLQQMIAPEQRRFNQETVPRLTEQFAGLGAGSLGSSGFRNSLAQASTDLGERIAAIRANLRQQGAQGLSNLSQQSLGNYYQNFYVPRTPGLLETLGPALGQIAAAGLAPATGGLSMAIPLLLNILGQGRGLQDQISGGIASGPYGEGTSYNPYTGVQ